MHAFFPHSAAIAALLTIPISACPGLAHAQDSAQAEEYAFDIPAQPITTALARFADLTHVNIAFRPQSVSDIRTQGINGRYSPPIALSLLLAQTGLGAVFTGPRSAVIYSLEAPTLPDGPSNDRNLPLITLDTAQVRATRIIGSKPAPFSSLDYARRAQARIRTILAAELDYQTAPYRARIGITSDAQGRITEVLVTRSQEKRDRNREVRALLIGRDLDGPPPEGTLQPMWFRISTDDLFSSGPRSDRR